MTTDPLPAPRGHLSPALASVEELGVLVDRAVNLAPNTVTAYRWQWRYFRTWCDDQGLACLPATPRAVPSGWTAGAAVSPLQLGRAAVRWVHREASHEDPTSDVAVTRFLGACNRGQEQRDSAAGNSRSAIPADAGLVRAMLDAIRWSDAAQRVLLRDRALIATAYVTAARRSELGALLLDDVEADGVEFRIRITRSKNQQTGKDRTAGVINSRTVRAADHLADWLAFHPLSGVPHALLFVQLHRSGAVPTRRPSPDGAWPGASRYGARKWASPGAPATAPAAAPPPTPPGPERGSRSCSSWAAGNPPPCPPTTWPTPTRCCTTRCAACRWRPPGVCERDKQRNSAKGLMVRGADCAGVGRYGVVLRLLALPS